MRLLAIALLLALTGCSETPLEAFIRRQNSLCAARGSTGAYDETTKVYECWRHAIGRNPKLMFREAWQG